MAIRSDQSEIVLIQEKEFSYSLLESMADGVVACDADGILTLFNCSAREWHGLDPLKLPPEEWAQHYDLFRADGITPLPTEEIPLARAFRGENVRDAGMAIKAKGRPIRFILANASMILDESGQKLGAVVIMRDVTEFRRLELELRKTNEELEQRVEKRTVELRKTAEDLNEAQRIANIGSWELDLLTNRLSWSDEVYRIFEIDPGVFGASFEAFLQAVHPDDREAVNAAYTNSVSTRTSYSIDHRLLLAGGRIKHVHEHCETFYENDKPIRSAGTVQDITERKRMEDALFFVAQRGWLADAENFFDALARYLGETLDVEYVVIDRLDENPDIAVTVALYAKGAIVPNMRYALKGTPCENVMGKLLCVYSEGAQRLFPEDTLLAEMGVESYIGIPLWDSSGRSTGLIALMGSKPLADTATATQLLQLVATRAAAELERERSDRILRTREHEFRTLANNLPDNIARYDREGRTVYVNPVLEKTLGAAAADMIGKQVRENHPDGSYEAYAHALDATLASGENREFEFVLPIPGEEPIVYHMRMIAERDDHGEVTGVLAIGHDITERKRAEEALHLQAVVLEEEVAERQMAQENLQEKALLLEEEIEKRQKTQDELERLNESLEQRVKERTAELEESQKALMNIVEDLNLKTEELVNANVKLQDLDRLKSMFIASMSHELRTPLNSIIGFSSIIRDEWIGPVNPEQKENLDTIQRSGKHLLSLINDVIDVSKIEAGRIEVRIEEFDLYDLLTEAVKYVEKDICDKGLELYLDIQHHPLRSDRRRLLQCVINLLSNAVKFTEHGEITVSSAVAEIGQGDEEQYPSGTATPLITISIGDTGIGIAEEDISRLFKAFERLDSPLKATVLGTGLGLYLTRKLVVEVLRGDILCESEAGRGSTFTLRIPERLYEKSTGSRG